MKITNRNHPLYFYFHLIEHKKKVHSPFTHIPLDFIFTHETYFNYAFTFLNESHYQFIKTHKSIKALNYYLKKYKLNNDERKFWALTIATQRKQCFEFNKLYIEDFVNIDEEYAYEILLMNQYEINTNIDKIMNLNNIMKVALNDVNYLKNLCIKYDEHRPLILKLYYMKIMNKEIEVQSEISNKIKNKHKTKPDIYTHVFLNIQPTRLNKEEIDINMMLFLNDTNLLTYLYNNSDTLQIDRIFREKRRRISNIRDFVYDYRYMPENVSEFLSSIYVYLDSKSHWFGVFYDSDIEYKKYTFFYENIRYIDCPILNPERVEYFMQFAFYRKNFLCYFDPLDYKDIFNVDFLTKYCYNRPDILFYIKLRNTCTTIEDIFYSSEKLQNKRGFPKGYFESFNVPSVNLLKGKLGILYIRFNIHKLSTLVISDILKSNALLTKEINIFLDEFIWHNCNNPILFLNSFKKIHDTSLVNIINNIPAKIDIKKYLLYSDYMKYCIIHLVSNNTFNEIMDFMVYNEEFILKCIAVKMREEPLEYFKMFYMRYKNRPCMFVDVTRELESVDVIFEYLMEDFSQNKEILFEIMNNQLSNCGDNYGDEKICKYEDNNYSNHLSNREDNQEDKNICKYEDNNLSNCKDNPLDNGLSNCGDFHVSQHEDCFTKFVKQFKDECTVEEATKLLQLKGDKHIILEEGTNINYNLIISDNPSTYVTDYNSFCSLITIYNYYKPYIFHFIDIILENIDKDIMQNCLQLIFNDKYLLFSVHIKIKQYLNTKNFNKNILKYMHNKEGYFTHELFNLTKTIVYSTIALKIIKTTNVDEVLHLNDREMVDQIISTTFEHYLDNTSVNILLERLSNILNTIHINKVNIEFGKKTLKIINNLEYIMLNTDYLQLKVPIFKLLSDDRFLDNIIAIFEKWAIMDNDIVNELCVMMEKSVDVSKVLVCVLKKMEVDNDEYVDSVCNRILLKNTNEENNEENNHKKLISNMKDVSEGVSKDLNRENNDVSGTYHVKNDVLNFIAYAPALKAFKKHKNNYIQILKDIYLTKNYEISERAFLKLIDDDIKKFIIDAAFLKDKKHELLSFISKGINQDIAKNQRDNNQDVSLKEVSKEVSSKEVSKDTSIDTFSKDLSSKEVSNIHDGLYFSAIYLLKFDKTEKNRHKANELWITHFKGGLIRIVLKELIFMLIFLHKNNDLFDSCFDEVLDKYSEILETYLIEIIDKIKNNTSIIIDHILFINLSQSEIYNTIIQNINFILNKAVIIDKYINIAINYSKYHINEDLIKKLVNKKQCTDKLIDIILQNKLEYEFILQNTGLIDKMYEKTKDTSLIPFLSNYKKMQLINSLIDTNTLNLIFQNFKPHKDWENFLIQQDTFIIHKYLMLDVPDFNLLKVLYEKVMENCNTDVSNIVNNRYAQYLQNCTFRNVSNKINLIDVLIENKIYNRLSELVEYFEEKHIIIIFRCLINGSSECRRILGIVESKDEVIRDYVSVVNEINEMF